MIAVRPAPSRGLFIHSLLFRARACSRESILRDSTRHLEHCCEVRMVLDRSRMTEGISWNNVLLMYPVDTSMEVVAVFLYV